MYISLYSILPVESFAILRTACADVRYEIHKQTEMLLLHLLLLILPIFPYMQDENMSWRWQHLRQLAIKVKLNWNTTLAHPSDSTWHIHRWICTLYRVTAVSMMSMWLSYNATCFQESYRSFIRNVTTLSNKYSHCTRRGGGEACVSECYSVVQIELIVVGISITLFQKRKKR